MLGTFRPCPRPTARRPPPPPAPARARGDDGWMTAFSARGPALAALRLWALPLAIGTLDVRQHYKTPSSLYTPRSEAVESSLHALLFSSPSSRLRAD